MKFEMHNLYANRNINQERLNAIFEYAGNSILDVGCGNGSYVLSLRERYDIKGIDYEQYATWELAPELFSVSDAAMLKLNNESVDTITCFETLEHLHDPEKALKEFYRVCRKNVILSVPNCEVTSAMLQSELIYKPWIDRTHVQFFDLNSFVGLVEKSGFKVVCKHYINMINLWPFLEEAFNFSGLLGKLSKKVLLRRQARNYYITCLVVGERKK